MIYTSGDPQETIRWRWQPPHQPATISWDRNSNLYCLLSSRSTWGMTTYFQVALASGFQVIHLETPLAVRSLEPEWSDFWTPKAALIFFSLWSGDLPKSTCYHQVVKGWSILLILLGVAVGLEIPILSQGWHKLHRTSVWSFTCVPHSGRVSESDVLSHSLGSARAESITWHSGGHILTLPGLCTQG